MSKRCALTGTRAQAGNKVSHSQRKTRRRFEPNVHALSLKSDALGQNVKLRITAATLRSIEHNGGLDSYLLTTKSHNLTPEAAQLKRDIRKAAAAKAAAAQ